MLTIEGHGKQIGRRPINDNPKATDRNMTN